MKHNNNIYYNMEEFIKLINEPYVIEFMNKLEYAAFIVKLIDREFVIVLN